MPMVWMLIITALAQSRRDILADLASMSAEEQWGVYLLLRRFHG